MFKKLYTLGLFALGLTVLNTQDVELIRVGGYATCVFDEGALPDNIQVLALEDLVNFNSTNDENDTYKNRSDYKGCEPEAIDVGTVVDHTFPFIGLERMGGVIVFDVIEVSGVEFKTYNNRGFTVDATDAAAGYLAPEFVKLITADKHSGSANLLAVSNEVSGTFSQRQCYLTEHIS